MGTSQGELGLALGCWGTMERAWSSEESGQEEKLDGEMKVGRFYMGTGDLDSISCETVRVTLGQKLPGTFWEVRALPIISGRGR